MVFHTRLVLSTIRCFFLLAATAHIAQADPIFVTGRVFVDDIPIERSVDVRLQLDGSEFELFGLGGDDENRRNFFPATSPLLVEGGPADLSGTLLFSRRPLFTGGVEGDTLFTGNFRFAADPSVLSCQLGGCSSSSRFSLTGNLIAEDRAGRKLSDRRVFGSGEVSAFFQGSEGPDVVPGRLKHISYAFDPAPVPEPGTLMLMATGLAGTLAAVRRRRTAAPK